MVVAIKKIMRRASRLYGMLVYQKRVAFVDVILLVEDSLDKEL